jgi:two-component system response regulator DesR
MIRILIAEDQALVLGALAALLGSRPTSTWWAPGRNGKEALALCRAAAPDIVLTDIEMPLDDRPGTGGALAERAAPARW